MAYRFHQKCLKLRSEISQRISHRPRSESCICGTDGYHQTGLGTSGAPAPTLWLGHASPYLYWSFVLPLAALFDGGRKLFEKGKAIREAKKAEIREKGRREGQEKERERITRELEELEASGVTLPPAVAEVVLGKRSQDDS